MPCFCLGSPECKGQSPTTPSHHTPRQSSSKPHPPCSFLSQSPCTEGTSSPFPHTPHRLPRVYMATEPPPSWHSHTPDTPPEHSHWRTGGREWQEGGRRRGKGEREERKERGKEGLRKREGEGGWKKGGEEGGGRREEGGELGTKEWLTTCKVPMSESPLLLPWKHK